jgi:hypothetical protein
MCKESDIVILPAGVGLNYGLAEDTDPLITTSPTKFRIVRLEKSAIVIHIINEDVEGDEDIYYHQPEIDGKQPLLA